MKRFYALVGNVAVLIRMADPIIIIGALFVLGVGIVLVTVWLS